MSPSEIAFMALGLLLGSAVGAAIAGLVHLQVGAAQAKAGASAVAWVGLTSTDGPTSEARRTRRPSRSTVTSRIAAGLAVRMSVVRWDGSSTRTQRSWVVAAKAANGESLAQVAAAPTALRVVEADDSMLDRFDLLAQSRDYLLREGLA